MAKWKGGHRLVPDGRLERKGGGLLANWGKGGNEVFFGKFYSFRETSVVAFL